MPFEQAAREFFSLRSRVHLNILLWGPGVSASTYAMRLSIKGYIEREFDDVHDVRLPEDPELKAIFENPVGDEVDEELNQALVANVIIALDISQGVGEEISRFSSYERIAHKMFLLSPKKYYNTKSMPRAFRNGLKIFWYTDEQYTEQFLGAICKHHIENEMTKTFGLLPY